MNGNNKIINWFPGHMTKALRMMAEEVKNIDAIIYVLDARAPMSCLNPSFYNLTENKPTLYVLNKADMCEKADVDYWVKFFNKQNCKAVALNSTESGSAKNISSILKDLCKDKIEKFKSKGMNIGVKAMVLGVPNSGKSTLTNNLVGKAKAKAGNKPGVTRGKQWINIGNGIELLDTPGTLWPSLDNQEVAKKLAFIGSISDNVLDINELSIELIDYFKNNHKSNLEERYNISIDDKENIEILEDICYSRKYLLKGNECDYDRTCRAIIDDFRKGKLGKITLDKKYV